MGPSPRSFVLQTRPTTLTGLFNDFKHRFTAGAEMARLIANLRRILEEHGSLNTCFLAGFSDSDETIIPALGRFTHHLREHAGHLVPTPLGGGACKRLNLFLRWMVRKDDVDPGGWKGIPAGKLVIPLDTHMQTIGRKLKLTRRKAPGLPMALEITESFRRFSPDDPVKYDFALTRFGIRADMTIEELTG